MAVIKIRNATVKNLPEDLANRYTKTTDTVTDLSVVDGSAQYDTMVANANALKTALNTKVDTSSIVNDLTTGGTSVPLSAEQGKVLKNLVDGMSSGLLYKGIWDASTGVYPADVSVGDFYKVSVAGIIDSVDYQIGDMIIANVDKVGATITADWDKIDNSESKNEYSLIAA